MRWALMITVAVAATLHAGCVSRDVEAESARVSANVQPPESRIRSITFSSSRPPEPGTLESLSEVGVSHVTLIPFGYQRDIKQRSISFDPNRRWYTESDYGISEVAAAANDLGMGTILKPHIWVGGWQADGQRRDLIGYDTEEHWRQWEASYRDFILHYAALAERIDADIFVIGTELATAARTRPDFWRSVAGEVRAIYRGKLSYAANWYAEYEEIQFWNSLDFVGVQAYFPLCEEETPSLSKLKEGWGPHLDALKAVSNRAGQPILFTEIGYRSVSDAAREPWRWASRRNIDSEQPNVQLQADLYQAFFESVWRQEWFAGASLWRWHTASESTRPVREIDFTPQGKPALDVIRTWYMGDTLKDYPAPEASMPAGN